MTAPTSQTYNFENESVIVNPTTGQVISSSQLQPATPITIPTADYTQTHTDASSAVAGVEAGTKSLNEYIASITPEPTAADKFNQSILDSLVGATAANTGKQAYQITQENNAGLPEFKTQMAQTKGEIAQRTAEFNAIDTQNLASRQAIDNEGGLTRSAYSGKLTQLDKNTAIAKATKASELTMLYAKQTALNGNIANAQAMASRAVDLKYQPIEDEIKVRQAQLAALEPILNKQEKTQALALQRKYEDEKQIMASAKDKEKQIQDLALTAAANGASQGIMAAITAAPDVDTAMQLAAPYLAKVATETVNVNGRTLLIDSQTGKTIRDLGVTSSPSGSSGSGGGGSGTGVLGLTNQQIDNISPLVTAFQNNDIVKNYNTIGENLNTVRTAGVTPTDDIQRIYAFARIMDPGSVVREGEYKTVQDYATSLLQRTGLKANRVFNNDGFLTDEARGFLLNTLENRFKASEKSYKNLYDETARRVNLIGNTDKGTDLLNNYGGAFVSPSVPIVGPVAPGTPPDKIVTTPETKGWWDRTTNWLFGDD
jgi:hypothetical protein